MHATVRERAEAASRALAEARRKVVASLDDPDMRAFFAADCEPAYEVADYRLDDLDAEVRAFGEAYLDEAGGSLTTTFSGPARRGELVLELRP